MSVTPNSKPIGTMAKTGENCPEAGVWQVETKAASTTPADKNVHGKTETEDKHSSAEKTSASHSDATKHATDDKMKHEDKAGAKETIAKGKPMPSFEGKPVTWKLVQLAA